MSLTDSQTRHRDSHEAAHHLFGVLRAPGVCKADERAVDRDPGAPLQLKHTKDEMQFRATTQRGTESPTGH